MGASASAVEYVGAMMNDMEGIEAQTPQVEHSQGEKWYTPLTCVTPLSKAFAVGLFILLPFVGFVVGVGWITEFSETHDSSRVGKAPITQEYTYKGESDERVRIVSPVEGQVYAPNDTVQVTVQIEPPLVAVDIEVRVLGGLGRFEGTNYDGSSYEVSFIVPEGFAGPITLIPAITDDAGTLIDGSPISIAVRSLEPPERIYLIQQTHFMDLLDGRTTPLRVIGVYSEEDERTITSSVTGTTYESSNPEVVTVNAEGRMTPISIGTAIITVNNSGVQDFAMIEVSQDYEPLPSESFKNHFTIKRDEPKYDSKTGFFLQQVQLTNISGKPILGPLYMVISGLSNGVELVNRYGVTDNIIPIGRPYVRLEPLLFSGLGVEPAQSFQFDFRFENPYNTALDYDVDIIRTSGYTP